MSKIVIMICKKCGKESDIIEFLDLPNKTVECPHCHHRIHLTEKQLKKLEAPK